MDPLARETAQTQFFVKTAQSILALKSSQGRLFGLVQPTGEIAWAELMRILPPAECVPFPRHPGISMTGALPAHLPIDQIRQLPGSTILFATDSGLNLQVKADSTLLHQVLWEQVSPHAHSTWSELAQHIQLPRDLALARSTASDILRSFNDESTRHRELEAILEICLPGPA